MKQRELNNQEDYFLNYNILIKIIQLSSYANMHWHHSKELKRPYVENLLLKKKLSSFQFLKPLLNSLSVQNLAEVAATCPAQLPRDRKDLGSIPATKLYFLFWERFNWLGDSVPFYRNLWIERAQLPRMLTSSNKHSMGTKVLFRIGTCHTAASPSWRCRWSFRRRSSLSCARCRSGGWPEASGVFRTWWCCSASWSRCGFEAWPAPGPAGSPPGWCPSNRMSLE